MQIIMQLTVLLVGLSLLAGYTNAGQQCDVDRSYWPYYSYWPYSYWDDYDQCYNGGTCVPLFVGIECHCAPGFRGRLCEIDINECESNPCAYYSQCVDGVNSYTCECVPGTTGPDCSIDIDDCESSPCQNGGHCHDILDGYYCTCLAPQALQLNYGGKVCTTYLSGCDDPSHCMHGSCVPGLQNDIHTYQCECNPGFTGDNCDHPTTISFVDAAFILVNVSQKQGQTFDLSLRFTTTLASATLALAKITERSYVLVQLIDGRIHVEYKMLDEVKTFDLYTVDVLNNEKPHTLHVHVSLNQNIVVSLPDELCLDDCTQNIQGPCNKSLAYDSEIVQNGVQFLYIGSMIASGFDDFVRDFRGCMDDVIVNGRLYMPGLPHGDYFNVGNDCTRQPQCTADRCSGRGRCEDLWYEAKCHCIPPYAGDACENE